MKQGSSLKDIDEMDIMWYFEVIGHAGKDAQQKKEKVTPIDEVGFL